MANRLISEMGLPNSIANIFAARNIKTAKDALSLTEFELMELLDVGLTEVTSALAYISEVVCPPFETALSLLEQRVQNEHLAGHLPTKLEGLDKALCGGIPFGVVTELVGPAGIGKTQFCLKLALLASLPVSCGGLDGHVIYIDVESKFSSRSLQQIKVLLLQNKAKLLIIDSMAALLSGEYEQTNPRQHALAWHISFIKSLAELSRIPIVVTNQVRSQSHDDSLFSFQHTDGTNLQMQTRSDNLTRFDTHLIAALGIHWAHAVSIRLILDSRSGQRYMKIAKSPMSPPLQFCFEITASGISFLSDDGVEVSGPQINAIHSHGHSDIIYCGDTC
ncbi:DNA repair protein RAD51 homolog 2-like isoform X2 [Chenopodium quinoa]|uniref:DNA repair protein RAD51 homolog 2-like isoform X2 n=1 Tax=Chenopodium quinoa TaxID=63459 RepID=UPI000B783C93|nr:DNA repair protein RAD51 homolog 2-like isoform X2 [Chenopodium quinoa]